MATYFKKTGESVEVDLTAALGSGGQGGVFPINAHDSDLVAKIFSPGSLAIDPEDKIEALIAIPNKPDGVAWPLFSLFDDQDTFVGYGMKKVSGVSLIVYIDPVIREAEIGTCDLLDLLALAISITTIFEACHNVLIEIGDANPENWLVAKSLEVVKVDAGSHQCFTRLPNGATKKLTFHLFCPEMLPAELFDFIAKSGFTRESDHFALAVLLFRLVFGVHPFSWRYENGKAETFEKAIRSGWYLFKPGNPPSTNMKLPATQYEPSQIPPEIIRLFETAFIAGYMRPDARPSAAVWRRALENWQLALVPQAVPSDGIFQRMLQSIAKVRQLRLAQERLERFYAAFCENPYSVFRSKWVAGVSALAIVCGLIIVFEIQGDSPPTMQELPDYSMQQPLQPNSAVPFNQTELAPKLTTTRKERFHFPGASDLWNSLANED